MGKIHARLLTSRFLWIRGKVWRDKKVYIRQTAGSIKLPGLNEYAIGGKCTAVLNIPTFYKRGRGIHKERASVESLLRTWSQINECDITRLKRNVRIASGLSIDGA